jgi:hypothetical protein
MDMVLSPEAVIDLENAGEDELAKLKLWLFHENMRVNSQRQELDEQLAAFDREKESVRQHIRNENKRIEFRKRQCATQEKLIEEKWKALKRGFDELDEDRQALKRLEKRLMDERRRLESDVRRSRSGAVRDLSRVTVFFKGVNDTLSLKKRYRDLIKIFHPDNLAGDKETVQSITREYDELRESIEEL